MEIRVPGLQVADLQRNWKYDVLFTEKKKIKHKNIIDYSRGLVRSRVEDPLEEVGLKPARLPQQPCQDHRGNSFYVRCD